MWSIFIIDLSAHLPKNPLFLRKQYTRRHNFEVKNEGIFLRPLLWPWKIQNCFLIYFLNSFFQHASKRKSRNKYIQDYVTFLWREAMAKEQTPKVGIFVFVRADTLWIWSYSFVQSIEREAWIFSCLYFSTLYFSPKFTASETAHSSLFIQNIICYWNCNMSVCRSVGWLVVLS